MHGTPKKQRRDFRVRGMEYDVRRRVGGAAARGILAATLCVDLPRGEKARTMRLMRELARLHRSSATLARRLNRASFCNGCRWTGWAEDGEGKDGIWKSGTKG
jgi:hypothetical protein